jgi:hypothetical protein
MRRWLLAAVALGFPVVGGLAYAGTASAAAKGVTCTNLTGTLSDTGTAKLAVSGCSDTKNTGGKGSMKAKATATKGTITWNGTGTTTVSGVTFNPPATDTCPTDPSTGTQETEEEVTGNITGGTGAAEKSIKAGWTIQFYLCAASSGALSIAPGTTFNIGASF